ncbi:hypothetical protein [uncultured Methylobacterium sp.]|uniref:hypothetical protein n=1 Tax=uncultured Methylobacterium sp. TaxID=157278 RepID=UPI0025934AEF|nr:hypothetical protein [uncultured Methylobacterium sp.]
MADDTADTSGSAAPADPALARALDVAKVAKAQADARSAGAAADTAEAGARTAAAKAILGEVPSAPYTGAVTTTESAALAEHNRLARQALLNLATAVAGDAAKRIAGKNVFVTTDDVGPARAASEGFKLDSLLARQALERASSLSQQLDPEFPHERDDAADAGPLLAAVPLVLSGLNTLLSFARSDHALSGRILAPGDRAFATAVAQELIEAGKTIRIDGPIPPTPEPVLRDLISELASLSSLASGARARAAHHAVRIKALSPVPQPAGDQADAPPPTDPDPDNQRPLHEQALASLDAAVKLFDALGASLLAVTEGKSGLARVAAARALEAFLGASGCAILIVKLDGVFGSALSSKGLLKSISGEIPYRLSVEVQASWRCFDATTSELIGAGLASKHVAFKDIEEIT